MFADFLAIISILLLAFQLRCDLDFDQFFYVDKKEHKICKNVPRTRSLSLSILYL